MKMVELLPSRGKHKTGRVASFERQTKNSRVASFDCYLTFFFCSVVAGGTSHFYCFFFP